MQQQNNDGLRQWQERWKEAREKAEGRWDSILATKAPQLNAAIQAGSRKHVPCPNPAHAGSKDAFRMFKDFRESGGGICNTCGPFSNGFEILKWANGWSGREALEEVEAYLGNRVARHAPKVVLVKASDSERQEEESSSNEKLRRSLNRVWLESIQITDEEAAPARNYLKNRGLDLEEMPDLRFHPRLAYHDGESVTGYFPAIIGMVKDSCGKAITIHRTYLTEDGRKAPVPNAKKIMSYPSDRKAMGSAIQLTQPSKVLAVTEGIETALAVQIGTKIPTWATVNAIMMQGFIPPKGVELVVVFADKDRSCKSHPGGTGQMAAKALVERCWAMNIPAIAVMPRGDIPESEKSLDWLDVLNREGFAGFPTLRSILNKIKVAA